jgi:hypothetical protein
MRPFLSSTASSTTYSGAKDVLAIFVHFGACSFASPVCCVERSVILGVFRKQSYLGLGEQSHFATDLDGLPFEMYITLGGTV